MMQWWWGQEELDSGPQLASWSQDSRPPASLSCSQLGLTLLLLRWGSFYSAVLYIQWNTSDHWKERGVLISEVNC